LENKGDRRQTTGKAKERFKVIKFKVQREILTEGVCIYLRDFLMDLYLELAFS